MEPTILFIESVIQIQSNIKYSKSIKYIIGYVLRCFPSAPQATSTYTDSVENGGPWAGTAFLDVDCE